MIAVATRMFPPEAAPADLIRQWDTGHTPGGTRTVLIRMPEEDPSASDHLAGLFSAEPASVVAIGDAWAAAQLAADATFIGMAIGVRVVLVPEGRRWFADLLLIRTRGRLRIARGCRAPERALASARRAAIRCLETDPPKPHVITGPKTKPSRS